MPGRDTIVIGASAGGVEALSALVGLLPADLPAAVFVVLHVPPYHSSVLPAILNRSGPLRALHPADGQPIEPGHIYVAPPDRHLLVRRGFMSVTRGPQENGHRPAIDPLFRTASASYGPRTIGVVLSGVLDDGAAGLATIKRRGGVAIVQDPDTALYTGMPLHAIDATRVDFVLDLGGIAATISRLARERLEIEEVITVGDSSLHSDDDLPDAMAVELAGAELQGEPSGFTCPLCHGALWERGDDNLLYFRCRVGHAYSSRSLLAAHSDSLDAALWAAVRSLEETAALRRRLAERFTRRGHDASARRFVQLAGDAARSADVVRQLLTDDGAVGSEASERADEEAQ